MMRKMSSWGSEHYSITRRKQKKGATGLIVKPKEDLSVIESNEPPTQITLSKSSPPAVRTPRPLPIPVLYNKLKPIRYETPTCTDTAVILVFFNPVASIRIQQNIVYVLHQLKEANIPVFIGELIFNSDTPLFTESETVFHYKSTSYMFYKENIINLVIRRKELESFTKFVILDADIVFAESNWLDRVSNALEECEILQPYATAYTLDKKFVSNLARDSVCKTPNTGHVGYAWAFRRDWFERVGGLFDLALTGGGDMCLTYMIGASDTTQDVYKPDISRFVDSKIGYVRTSIFHLPHGLPSKRQLESRIENLAQTLRSLNLKRISDAVVRNSDGIIEWKPQYKNLMNTLIQTYFKTRDDDNLE
jgi:hypothetical protein